MIAREGGCQCGTVRYRIHGEPLVVSACHCDQCRRQSGSAFGMTIIFQRDDVSMLGGSLKSFERSSDSANKVTCYFCGDCGTRIYHALERSPGTINIKPGTLDDSSDVTPALHIWVSKKRGWVTLPDDVPQFEEQPS